MDFERLDLDNIEDVSNKIGIEKEDKIYFEDENKGLNVYEVVNKLLVPYGFTPFSQHQFKSNIAGGSKHSADKIKNYAEGRGRISNGYTYLPDILEYCRNELENSVEIPLENVIEVFKWARKLVNEGNITLQSGGGKRYDVQVMIDITKGLLGEEAFKIEAQNHGHDVKLDREVYEGTRNTDDGQDVKEFSLNGSDFQQPQKKVQIKDIKYFLLIPQSEFNGKRSADYFLAYDAHWSKEITVQRFFRALGGEGEEIFNDYPPLESVRVSRRGWAKREDFSELPAGERVKGKSFPRNDNMYVHWTELREMDGFWGNKAEELI